MMIKRIIIPSVIVFLSSTASAESLQTALEHYKEKNYIQSYQVLKKVEFVNSNNPKLFFYLGRTAFELKKHDEALDAFNRSLEIDPNNPRTRLEKARTLFVLEKYTESKKEFENVLNSNVPSSVKTNVEKYLTVIEKRTKQHYFAGAVMLGFGRDTNVLHTTFEDVLFEFNGIEVENTADKKKSIYHQEALIFNHQYRFKDQPNLTWSSGLTLYNQGFNDASEGNMFLWGLSTGPTYLEGKYKFTAPLGYNRIKYGGNDYLAITSLSPKVEYLYDKTLTLKAQVKVQDKNYQKNDDKDRESKYKGLELALSKAVFQTDMIKANISYSKERKERGSLLDIDKDTRSYSLGYTKSLTNELNGTLSYTLTEDSYKDDQAFDMGKRVDKKHAYSLKLNYQARKDLSVDLGYTYTKNKSTLNPYKYKKSNYFITTLMTF